MSTSATHTSRSDNSAYLIARSIWRLLPVWVRGLGWKMASALNIPDLDRALTLDHSPICLPWFVFAYSKKPMARIHRMALKQEWKRGVIRHERRWQTTMAVLWPIKAPLLAASAVWRHGQKVRDTFGISRIRQFSDLAFLLFFLNITPATYYRFQLFRRTQRRHAALFLQDHEIRFLMPEFNCDCCERPINDKAAFIDFASRLGIPVVEYVHWSPKGDCASWRSVRLSKTDLFLKWTDMSCGVGAEKWTYCGDADTWMRKGRRLDSNAFLDYCANRTQERSLLLQKCVQNHPALAPFSSGGLCTVRVVTQRLPGQCASPLLAVLRMPSHFSEVDNFAAGGLAADLDLNTGVLQRVILKDFTQKEITDHPDTGERILGATLPFWQDILSTATTSHDLVETPWSIGWDIAVTPDGIRVVEGNTTWCVDVGQGPSLWPLGRTRFADDLNSMFDLVQSPPSAHAPSELPETTTDDQRVPDSLEYASK